MGWQAQKRLSSRISADAVQPVAAATLFLALASTGVMFRPASRTANASEQKAVFSMDVLPGFAPRALFF